MCICMHGGLLIILCVCAQVCERVKDTLRCVIGQLPHTHAVLCSTHTHVCGGGASHTHAHTPTADADEDSAREKRAKDLPRDHPLSPSAVFGAVTRVQEVCVCACVYVLCESAGGRACLLRLAIEWALREAMWMSTGVFCLKRPMSSTFNRPTSAD